MPRAAAAALAGGAIAVAASLAVLFLAGPLVGALGHLLGPDAFAGYAAVGSVAALAWVWAGAQAEGDPRRRAWLAVLLFVAGAVVARRLVLTANSSPFHGLAELAAVYAGGGLGVVLAVAAGLGGRRRPGRRVVAAGLLLPLLAVAATSADAWTSPQHGRFGYLHLDDGERVAVRWIDLSGGDDDPASRRTVVWGEGSAADAVARAAAAGPLRIETDVGSGTRAARAYAPAPQLRAEVARAVEVDVRHRLALEVRAGHTPSAFAALPLPRSDLRRVALFAATPP